MSHAGTLPAPRPGRWLEIADKIIDLRAIQDGVRQKLLPTAAITVLVGVSLLTVDQRPSSERLHRAANDTTNAGEAGSINSLDVDRFVVRESTMEQTDQQFAKSRNTVIPFADLGSDQPAALHVQAGTLGYSRALDCLASAMIYEAGDDHEGQAAVAQVIMNRVRHPAYPHSVCGVVYQGSERTTGCQFTFTCDGALHRSLPPASWERARRSAAQFLAGGTNPTVGMATHYHTDWVHPYWSDELEKIARVGTHLFFRWRGGWGKKRAFTSAYAGIEPLQQKLAALSSAHRVADGDPVPAVENAGLVAASRSTIEEPIITGPGEQLIKVEPAGNGKGLAMLGLEACGDQSYCKVIGWAPRSDKAGLPEVPSKQSVAFLYIRDRRTGVELVLWDCARFDRPSTKECLTEQNRRWIGFRGDYSQASR